jgi:glycerate-2-kinase
VLPGPATQRAISHLTIDGSPWIRILALGKASAAMASAAADALETRGLRVRDGLAVPPHTTTLAHPAFEVVPGDHPIPGPRSARAAKAVAAFARAGRPEDLILVLLSGGTSSLIGAPVPPLASAEFAALSDYLLRSGLPIATVNRIRRRCAQWGGGRLAAALAPSRVEVLALSDVPGDALEDIGSGPCSPDPDRAGDLRSFLGDTGRWRELPPGIQRFVDDTIAGRIGETPKPGDAAFAAVSSRIVAGNADAVAGALAAAARLGLRAEAAGEPLTGEASAMGRRIAERLLALAPHEKGSCLVWGGETTVALPPGSQGTGGRCQELALAAAKHLATHTGPTPAVLAAGTDGRDGLSPAAGGIVTPGTWAAIARAGRNPQADLASHNSHPALDSVGATLVTGPTGTNVMDLAIGLVQA